MRERRNLWGWIVLLNSIAALNFRLGGARELAAGFLLIAAIYVYQLWRFR